MTKSIVVLMTPKSNQSRCCTCLPESLWGLGDYKTNFKCTTIVIWSIKSQYIYLTHYGCNNTFSKINLMLLTISMWAASQCWFKWNQSITDECIVQTSDAGVLVFATAVSVQLIQCTHLAFSSTSHLKYTIKTFLFFFVFRKYLNTLRYDETRA